MLRENSDMERQMSKLRTDLKVSNNELLEKTSQLTQLRKRTYCIDSSQIRFNDLHIFIYV